jgi:hypothetical protein
MSGLSITPAEAIADRRSDDAANCFAYVGGVEQDDNLAWIIGRTEEAGIRQAGSRLGRCMAIKDLLPCSEILDFVSNDDQRHGGYPPVAMAILAANSAFC